MHKTRLSIRGILVAVTAAGFIGSGLPLSPQRPSSDAPGRGLSAHAFQSVLNGQVYLFCGPNDGELLNGVARLQMETNYMREGHVLVFAGSRVVGCASFSGPASLSTVRTIYCLVDTRQIENSRVELRFVLFTPNYTSVLAFDSCEVDIQNPHFEALPNTTGLTPLQLQGRPDDSYYLLVVGNQAEFLRRVPDLSSVTPGTQIVARGHWVASSTSPRTRIIVTDLDILFRIHGLNTQLVLWTYNSEKGWARSAIKRLRDLVPGYRFPTTYSESLQQEPAESG